MAKDKSDFYCENCKRSVPIDAQDCPYCGATFSGVKCPQCAFSAGMQAFIQGCPRCGYSQFDTLNSPSVAGTKKSAVPIWVGFLWVVLFLTVTVFLGLWYLWQR